MVEVLYVQYRVQVRLPACVLEPRSLLQSYGSAFGRSDLFTSMSEADTPQQRLELVVAFYLSQLKCMRPTRAALKPYNPMLGEIFVSEWPAASEEESPVYFLAEQVFITMLGVFNNPAFIGEPSSPSVGILRRESVSRCLLRWQPGHNLWYKVQVPCLAGCDDRGEPRRSYSGASEA